MRSPERTPDSEVTCPECGGAVVVSGALRAFCVRPYEEGGCGRDWALEKPMSRQCKACLRTQEKCVCATHRLIVCTSNFARLSSMPDEHKRLAIPIVALLPDWIPDEIAIRNVEQLSPKAWMVKALKAGTMTWADYAQRYHEDILAPLDRFKPEALVLGLKRRLPPGADGPPILLCWCGAHECHRHLLSRWLTARGVSCAEYPSVEQLRPQQATLF